MPVISDIYFVCLQQIWWLLMCTEQIIPSFRSIENPKKNNKFCVPLLLVYLLCFFFFCFVSIPSFVFSRFFLLLKFFVLFFRLHYFKFNFCTNTYVETVSLCKLACTANTQNNWINVIFLSFLRSRPDNRYEPIKKVNSLTLMMVDFLNEL